MRKLSKSRLNSTSRAHRSFQPLGRQPSHLSRGARLDGIGYDEAQLGGETIPALAPRALEPVAEVVGLCSQHPGPVRGLSPPCCCCCRPRT